MMNFLIYKKVKLHRDDGSVDSFYVKRWDKFPYEKRYAPSDIYIDGKLQTYRKKKIVISGTLVEKIDEEGKSISKEFWSEGKQYPELLQFI